jgi:hypothetical protein
VGPGRIVSVEGPNVRIEHATRPTVGGPAEYPEILAGEYVYVPEVPIWLLHDVFSCGSAGTFCSRNGHPDSAFDLGALLFVQEMAGRPSPGTPGYEAELGPVLRLAGYETAPPSGDFAAATHMVLTHLSPGSQYIHYVSWDNTSFQEYRTYARSRWVDDALLTLIPLDKEILSTPVAWDVFARFSSGADPEGSADSLRGSPAGPLLPYVYPPTLEFLIPSTEPG